MTVFCIYSLQNAHSAETMIANVAQALDIIRDNIPRAYVNLVEIFDISPVAGLGNGIICSLVHGFVFIML